MKKKVLFASVIALVVIAGCKKKEDDQPPTPVTPLTELQVLTDFANVLVNPNYADLKAKAGALNAAVVTLETSTTEANLIAAQNAWRAVRVPWEQSEAFLFGPADDFNYDPATDTWPVNTVELDSLISSTNPLALSDVDALEYSLKGYHAIEYILFGIGSSRSVAQLNSRLKQYLVSLTQSLYNATTQLRDSWNPDFTNELITAGAGSTRFSTRKEAFLAIVGALQGICLELGTGGTKISQPLAGPDSTIVESHYAHNATEDFRNNIVGIQNVYFCRYTNTGKSLHDLVNAKDISLDNEIQAQISSALASLNAIDDNFGLALFTQQGEIQQALFAIDNLNNILGSLDNFIQTNIID